MTRLLLVLAPTLLLAACSGTRTAGTGEAPRTAISTGTLASDGQINLDIEVRPGDALAVYLESAAFDSYLRVFGPSGAELSNDDYGGAGVRDAFVYARTPAPGTWRVVGTAYNGSGAGAYRLVAVTGAPVEVRGTLAATDPTAPGRSFADAVVVAANPGDLVVADLGTGEGLDGYVYAVAADGGRFENDDWESSRQQAVVAIAAGRGPVTVVATALGVGTEGRYTLRVLAPSGEVSVAPASAVAAALDLAPAPPTPEATRLPPPPAPSPRPSSERDDAAFGEAFNDLTTSVPNNFAGLVGAEANDEDDPSRYDARVRIDGALDSYFSIEPFSGDFTYVAVYGDDLASEADAEAVVTSLTTRMETVPFRCDPYVQEVDRSSTNTISVYASDNSAAECQGHTVEIHSFLVPSFTGDDTWNVVFRIRKTS